MISERIIKAVIAQAKPSDRDFVLTQFIKNVSNGYDYEKVNYILEMLLGKPYITVSDINIDYIKDDIGKFVYRSEDYNIKDVNIVSVDNIDCVVLVNYKYYNKSNTENENEYNNGRINISWLDCPKILEKKNNVKKELKSRPVGEI